MPDNPPLSRQQQTIRQTWPRTARQLESTFFPSPDWALSDRSGHNAAGYLLWGLNKMADYVARQYNHRQYTSDELDLAASREVYYQWINRRQFSNIPAALSRCLLNLVIERPEKLMEARKIQAGQPGKKAPSTPQTSSAQSTAIRSSSPGGEKRESTPTPIEYALQELTRLNCCHAQSQAASPPAFTYNASATPVLCASFQHAVGPIATAG